MNNELKYPVKYAVLELCTDAFTSDIVYVYIVSKCYVVGENIRYYSDGSSKSLYNVVFPYQDFSKFNGSGTLEKRIIPEILYGNICNYQQVDCLFDDYYLAKTIADEKNCESLGSLLALISVNGDKLKWINRINEVTNSFSLTLEKCNLYEQHILLESEDMNVTSNLISDYKKVKKI